MSFFCSCAETVGAHKTIAVRNIVNIVVILFMVIFICLPAKIHKIWFRWPIQHFFCLKSSMIINEYTLMSSYDGLPVSLLEVRPETRPLAVMQIAHGMCGYKERYLPFMKYMASHGVMCIANDHRGHGHSILSDDDLGFMYEGGYEALVSDMRMVFKFGAESCPATPFYLLGHSMGSLASLLFAKRWGGELSGLILCGVPSRPFFTTLMRSGLKMLVSAGGGRLKLKFTQNLTSYLYNRRFKAEGVQAWTCSDPSMRLLIGGTATTGFYFAVNGLYNLMCMLDSAYSKESSDKYGNGLSGLPVLLMSGEEDPCSDFTSSLYKISKILTMAGSSEIIIKTYPAMRHEILNETGKEKVWLDILQQIKRSR